MSASSTEPTRLREIMLRRYLRLGEEHTIAEIMGFLSDAHFKKDGLPYLVVLRRDGTLAGMLPPKAIFRVLAPDSDSTSGNAEEFLATAASKLSVKAGEIMTRDTPVLSPDDRLEAAYRCIQETATDVIALVEENRVVGLVTARILFETASRLTVGSLSGGVIPPGGPAQG
jgi:CBS domain-containing protein